MTMQFLTTYGRYCLIRRPREGCCFRRRTPGRWCGPCATRELRPFRLAKCWRTGNHAFAWISSEFEPLQGQTPHPLSQGTRKKDGAPTHPIPLALRVQQFPDSGQMVIVVFRDEI